MNLSTAARITFKIFAVVLVTALAWNLRFRAANLLPPDYDEDDYLRAAQEYAAIIRAGEWDAFLETNYRPEHPPLAKIVFGISLLAAPEQPRIPDRATSAPPDAYLSRELLIPARIAGAIEGTLAVFLLALINPLGAAALAAHTFTIKYNAQVMLEALPALTSFISVLAYVQFKKRGTASWLIVSAILLGLTAASKYMYCLAGIAIILDWLMDAKRESRIKLAARNILIWGMIALAVFVIFDPYLWANPLGRLRESVFYHAQYSSGASEVTSANFAIWQPFIWLTMSPALWHPMVFAFAPDLFITILAGFGIQRLWRKEKVFVLWLASALVFLLLWQTKWPQYILVLTIPLALAAGEAIGGIAENAWDAVKRFRKQDKVSARMDRRRLKQSAPWLIPGAIIFVLFTIVPLLYQIAISLTDFNSAAIRDGLNGGVWREVIGGLTGQITPSLSGYPSRANTVHYTGPQMYFPVLNFIAGDGFLVFTTLWTILSVGLQTLLGLGAALLIWNKRIPLRRFWQALFILPWAIPETIGALMWLTIFAPHSGWLFLAVQDFGKDIPFAFLNGWEASPNSIMLVLLIAGLWYGFPFMMLAAAAALKQVSSDVLDAAAIDGANPWQLIRHVILPLLSPLIIPAVIIRGIFAFNQFYLLQTFLFLHEDGSFQTLAGLSYNIFNPSGFYGGAGQFSTSAVLNILTILILSGFVIAFNRWSKADEGVDYA